MNRPYGEWIGDRGSQQSGGRVGRRDPKNRSFSIAYLREGRIVALDCVNAVKDYVQGRAFILAGSALTAEKFADISVPLNDMLAN